jgi:pimeloyl-ACP methyl ester carboxylesterase
VFAPHADEGFLDRHAAYLRAGASPRAAADLNRMNLALDLRHLLPAIRVPVLALSRHGDPIAPPAAAKYMVARIEEARFVELEGEDHVIWAGEIEPLCSEVERFVQWVEAPRAGTRNVSGTRLS